MNFIEFNIPPVPKWRTSGGGKDKIPSICEMLKDIVHFRKKHTGAKVDPSLEDVKKALEKKFFVDIQIEEDCGVKDIGTTETLIDEYERREHVTSTRKRRHSGDNVELSHAKRPQLMTRNSVEEIESLYQSKSEERQNPAKSEKETINLYKAYKNLKCPLEEEEEKDRNEFASLLDVDYFIKETHEILMEGLEEKFKTSPGTFSTEERFTVVNGKKHEYHKFNTEEEASKAVQTVVDSYNRAVKYLKSQKDDMNKVEGVFKCSAKLLFCFLTLHPFSDGNGRLGRLLCNYCLSLISPFPTAVYNVYSPSTRDDYIKALIGPRGDAKEENFLPKLLFSEPSDLCAMIIESNWYSWKEFFNQTEKYANERKNLRD